MLMGLKLSSINHPEVLDFCIKFELNRWRYYKDNLIWRFLLTTYHLSELQLSIQIAKLR